MTIKADIQTPAPGAIVDMYILDATAQGAGSVLYFHAGVNQLGNDVVWQGVTYTRMPLIVTGFERTSKGAIPRPKMQVSNIGGLVGAYVHSLNDLIGAKVTRKRTLLQYLDAVNFAAGNPTADPTQEFPEELFTVVRKATENKTVIEFELGSAMDAQGVKLPRRQCLANICGWIYRGAECGYAGGAVADATDTPTTVLANDQCGKRLASCALRFGATAELPYGGFPGAGLLG